jgi:MoaA/NifB/PqqE/SkfB family radical SAM enzyme
MGCQSWAMSGGEPMLRPDFTEIFDYITRKAITYNLNTNGTLITPEIAQLLTRKGNKMIALYGATADVHDKVTCTPGSFEATMRGFAYLREAGVGFIVQLVPMRSNVHQLQQMQKLAQTLSPISRIGAAWLWLSACRSDTHNRQIIHQRLDPASLITIDEPYPLDMDLDSEYRIGCSTKLGPRSSKCVDDRLFAACIAGRREFHIDPYGGMSFCSYIKDPSLRYDLRKGSFSQAWNEFIPSLAGVIHGDQEYLNNCGACELRKDCRWCAVYAYLEHGRYSAKVDYLCQLASETRQFKDKWKLTHLCYFNIAGITIQIITDFPITENTFSRDLTRFQVSDPGLDTISLYLNSSPPPYLAPEEMKEIYRKPPWAIYRYRGGWVYQEIGSDDQIHAPEIRAIFDETHDHGRIFRPADHFRGGCLHSLTTFTSDQILLARILSDRQGCYMHSSGIAINGQGLLFVGHSEAGKSTMLKMLRGQGEILCDDRIILRRWPEGFRIHGTWSHGELPDVSPASAPLRAILYLEQAQTNELIPIEEKREKLGRFLSHVVKPLVTADWWEKTLDLAGYVATEVPAYRLKFDKSGRVLDLLQEL